MFGVKLAYYNKKDWKRFTEIADDRESLHDTWNQWHKDFLKMKKNLLSQGMEVVDVEVDLDELIRYCQLNGLKNNGSTRSRFVQTK